MDSEASPLPEGRAGGREAVLDEAFSAAWKAYMGTKGSNHQSMILSWRNAVEAAADVIWASVAAPVVAVPGNEAGALSPDLAADAARPEAGEGPMGRVTPLCTVCDRPNHAHIGRGHDFAPAVPVGVQPASEAATSATDRAVPTRPEPAEEACPHCGNGGHEAAICGWRERPAAPVVHPEPASESSDSVAELVADTTRSGDRPACVFCEKAKAEKWRRTVESFEPLNPVTPGHRLFVPREHVTDAAENHVLTGAVFEAAARYAESRGEAFNLITSAGAAASQTVPHLHIHYVPRRFDDGLPLPWTGQRDVAAAVAAVRADLAARLLAERLDPEDVTSFWYEGINAGLARALSIVRGES